MTIIDRAREWTRSAARELAVLVDALPSDQRTIVLDAPCPWRALDGLRIARRLGDHADAEGRARMLWSMAQYAMATHAPHIDPAAWLECDLLALATPTSIRLAGWDVPSEEWHRLRVHA